MVEEEIIDFVLTDKSRKNGEEYRRNGEWFDEHFEEIRKEHPGKIIIVLNQEVWDTAESPSEVHDKLRDLPRGRQLQSYIEFVPKEGAILMF